MSDRNVVGETFNLNVTIPLYSDHILTSEQVRRLEQDVRESLERRLLTWGIHTRPWMAHGL